MGSLIGDCKKGDVHDSVVVKYEKFTYALSHGKSGQCRGHIYGK